MATVNLTQANHQWSTRPNDERYWNIGELADSLRDERTRTREREVPGKDLFAGEDNGDLCLLGNNGKPVKLTNWSYGQLCGYSGAPASYLKDLPAELAARCLNHGLRRRNEDKKANLLLRRDGDHAYTLRSVTTDAYARLWNDDIVNSLQPATEHGWVTPPARPARGDDPRTRPATAADILPGQEGFWGSVRIGQPIAPAGVYASDRDMFIFMVNPNRMVIDEGEGLMRGFFLWNSEVGAGAFKVNAFLFEQVCSNHIVWNAHAAQTLRVVHKGNAIRRVTDRLADQLSLYGNRNTSAERDMITAAKRHVLGADRKEVIDNLYGNRSIGLSQTVIEASYDVAVEYEHTAHANPNTAWGFVHGLTRYSQRTPYTDERSRLDAAGGKILELSAKSAGVDIRQLALPSPN